MQTLSTLGEWFATLGAVLADWWRHAWWLVLAILFFTFMFGAVIAAAIIGAQR